MSVLKIYDGSNWVPIGNMGSASSCIDCSGGTSDTYGVLTGAVNGVNTVYTVSQSVYVTGTLKVYLNGQLQTQGSGEDWTETSPIAGTFTFITAPLAGDIIIAMYDKIASTLGNADMVDGIHASITPVANKILPLNSNAAIDVRSTYIENTTSDEDLLIKINDGGTTRTAIQINAIEGSVTMPRQSIVSFQTSSVTTVATSTWTIVGSTGYAEIHDVLSECSDGLFTAKTAGKYYIIGHVIWNNINSGVQYTIGIHKNNSLSNASYINIGTSAILFPQTISGIYNLAIGNTLSIKVFQPSGGNETLTQYENYVNIIKVA